MAGNFADYDPNMGQADRAKRRKDFPRGTGTGQPDIEEGGAMASGQITQAAPGAAREAALGMIAAAPVPTPYRGPLGAIGGPLVDMVANAGIPGNKIGQLATFSTPATADSSATPSGYPAAPVSSTRVAEIRTAQAKNAAPTGDNFGPGVAFNVPQRVAVGPSDGMTDDQRMNAPWNAAATQMAAEKKGRDAAQAQFFTDEAQRNQRLAAGPSYRDLEQARSAARAADWRATNGADMVLSSSGSPTGGNPARAQRLAIIGAARNAQERVGMLEGQAQVAANAGPRRDLVAEQIAQQHGADTSAVTQLGAAQTALMNPLAVQQAKQTLATAGTTQDIAKIALADRQHRMDLLKEMSAPGTTPERQAQIHDALLAQSDKEKAARYVQHPIGGGQNELGQMQPQGVGVLDTRTGQFKQYGGAGSTQPTYIKGERRTMNGETREFDGKEWKKI